MMIAIIYLADRGLSSRLIEPKLKTVSKRSSRGRLTPILYSRVSVGNKDLSIIHGS